MDDDDVLTCYHEAGHAVVGFLLGGRIERIQLGGESHDSLPAQFGDCLIHWQFKETSQSQQLQRELLTILAGPVAEMIYRGEKLHPALFEPWQLDWSQAMDRCVAVLPDPQKRTWFLESLLNELHLYLQQDEVWAAIAAVADELSAHEFLEREMVEDCLRFWIS